MSGTLPEDRTPPNGQRSIVAGGVLWTVREADARAVPGARRPRCLIFESRDRVCRFWYYPDAWESLPDETLARMLDGDVRRSASGRSGDQ